MKEPLLVANNLWRGPRPPSFQWLQDRGFDAVIDLEWGWRDAFTDSEYERERKRSAFVDAGTDYKSDYNLWFYPIPCSDFTPPSKYQVKEFLLRVAAHDKGKVYIHCLTGVDRTGFMCAQYRQDCQSWSKSDAYAEWVTLGRHWWYDWWKYWM